MKIENIKISWFLPVRRYASTSTSYGPLSVCLPACPPQVGVLSKRMDGSSWFFAKRLPSTYEVQTSTK